MNIKIFISCNRLVNSKASLDYILDKILDCELSKTDIHIIREDARHYEYPALKAIFDESKNKDFYGLYLHCKGSSKTDIDLFNNNLAWAYYMLYGLIDNSNVCIDYLKRGADLVGSMWYRHFKGNFFWFNSRYLRHLVCPYEVRAVSYEELQNPEKNGDRFLAEYWISQAYWFTKTVKPKVKNLFYLPIKSDNDFIELKEKGYVPKLDEMLICNSLEKTIQNNDFRVFDKVLLTSKDVARYGDSIKDYMNFDCELERIDL